MRYKVTHIYKLAATMNIGRTKIFFLTFFLLTATIVFSQKRFPKFNYITINGDTINNSFFNGHQTMVIVGHLSCPAMFSLLKDIEMSKLDTIQFLLLLENTSDQIISFNTSTDTNNIWASQRRIFKLQPILIPTVTFCKKERLGIKKNGTIRIKDQCHSLKLKYRAFDTPTLFAINPQGYIVKKESGWFWKASDPDSLIIKFLAGKE
jgi:hypothetical protein